MKFPVRRLLACALIVGLSAPASVFATNGYFLIGYGSKSRAMGGVGVALGQDGLAAGQNPATMIEMRKTRVDLAAELFIPYRAAFHDSALLPTDPDPITGAAHPVRSGQNLFLIPAMGGVYKFNRNTRMGMAVIGGGAGTRYGQAVSDDKTAPNSSNFFNFQGNARRDELGVLLLNMQMLPSIAYEFLRHKKWGRHTVGASLAIGISAFRARGLAAFGGGEGSLPGEEGIGFTNATDKLTDNGVDFSFGSGVRIGWLGRFNKKKLNVGINYATKVYMTPFEKYTGLFAEQGTFDIPEHYAIGVAVKANKKITIAMDIQRINYSNVASIANSGPISDGEGGFFERCPEKDTDVTKCYTGEGSGLGFGWTDQTIYKLGVAYEHNKKWSFRGGLNYGKSPIPDDQILFNMLAPATVEKHLTFGFSYRPNKQNEFSFNYMRAFNNEQTGPTAFPPIGPEDSTFDNAAISMNQHSIGATWGINI
ncbi:MAG TPA: hypothetical protein EYO59_07420 [Chromatiaceae bacterium]|nr:hypothetical protein [Chromatiaceae bacterium]